ncbi:peptide chain release factor N(5)-glutamine methyltransferase [Candidatus Margulisiibacteriota bacterium]
MKWTITSLLQWTQDYFQKNKIDAPRLTAELLLADVLKVNRLDLYLRYDAPVSEDELASFKKYIQRRVSGEPLQYILGKAWFMGMELAVSRDVLIPRPETEVLVEKVVDWFRNNQPTSQPANQLTVVDIGTGSGCIAVSMAKFVPDIKIYATDISEAAINVALTNAEQHEVEITFKRGDLLTPVMDKISDSPVFIVSNPPYVTEHEWPDLQQEVKDHEPDTALLAGENGLEYYRKIIDQSRGLSAAGFAFEAGIGQAGAIADLLRCEYPDFKIDIMKDLEQVDRIVMGYGV